MRIPLEDNFSDILSKAQRGLELADSQLCQKTGLTPAALKSLRNGQLEENALRKVAPHLGLNAGALLTLARRGWQPEPIGLEGLHSTLTSFGEMTVNAYLVWDPSTREAVIFDTGTDCNLLLRFLENHRLKLKMIALTHTHRDHVYDLPRLQQTTGAPVFVSEREPFRGAASFVEGSHFDIGGLKIETRLTWGHSPGGTTYVVRGLQKPVAIVGDALFAGSMGGGNVSYQNALRTNRTQILTLPEETILCPGHGPMTTVGEEKRHNPFFCQA